MPNTPKTTWAMRASAATAACCAGLALLLAAGPANAEGPAKEKIPALMSSDYGWVSAGTFLDPPPGSGHGPMKQDPAFAFHGNLDGPGQVTFPLGNIHDPVLKPWAAKQMQASNEEVLSGARGLPFSAQALCYPGGIPGQLLYPIEPMYFIQTPTQVYMIWQRDHMVRRIYLTDHHSEVVKPSWFGESIGHYENGDTLVVDTIGLQTRNSFIDLYRTPHTEEEHVIERYRISDDRKTLEAAVTVEDPGAFTEPLHMVKRWYLTLNPRLETVCAENNGDHFSKNLFPIPEAKTSDF